MISQKYFESFTDNGGLKYGLRFGTANDAEEISKMFIEAYGHNYLYKMVYEPSELEKKIEDPDNFWFICENIDHCEIAGVGLMQKRKYTIYIGKMIIKKKFQKKGIARVLGSRGIMTCLNKAEFRESYKLLTEARTEEINAQKMMERIAIPYAFIPEFINFGDRRMFDFSKGDPFVNGEKESALLFMIPFERLWQYRETKIYVPKNEEILFFYNYLKSYNRKTLRMMKRDEIITEISKKSNTINFTINEDLAIGFVSLIGLLNEGSLEKILSRYNRWRIIYWEIPLTSESTHSVELALKNEFTIIGYNIGSYFDPLTKKFWDSLILCKFPRGLAKSFDNLKIIEGAKPLVDRIIKSLP